MCEKQQETIANKYQEYKMNTEHYRLSFAFFFYKDRGFDGSIAWHVSSSVITKERGTVLV